MDKTANVQQKRKRAPKRMFNQEVVNRLAAKYGVKPGTVRQAVNQSRTSRISLEIREEYFRINKEVQKAVSATLEELENNNK